MQKALLANLVRHQFLYKFVSKESTQRNDSLAAYYFIYNEISCNTEILRSLCVLCNNFLKTLQAKAFSMSNDTVIHSIRIVNSSDIKSIWCLSTSMKIGNDEESVTLKAADQEKKKKKTDEH
jgi:hypothetical protein